LRRAPVSINNRIALAADPVLVDGDRIDKPLRLFPGQETIALRLVAKLDAAARRPGLSTWRQGCTCSGISSRRDSRCAPLGRMALDEITAEHIIALVARMRADRRRHDVDAQTLSRRCPR
jgi:hypothetical protein